MIETFEYHEGKLPLLISIPHDGREIPSDIRARMSDVGRQIPDTDWDVARLYGFAKSFGASTLTARYSRYVVDLNRSSDDAVLYDGQRVTGLCPEETFAGDPIYSNYTITDEERLRRVDLYWRPYHARLNEALAAMREKFGYALLWDAHTIESTLPLLFEGELPQLNLGSNDGKSCAASLQRSVTAAMRSRESSSVTNGRFKGGYITRHYGRPQHNVHALQLEIAQRAYRDERAGCFVEDKAKRLRVTLNAMLDAFLKGAKE